MNSIIKIQDQPPTEGVTSLTTFINLISETDINTCYREQAHLPGAVQSVGALLVVCQRTLNIVAYSPNVIDILGIHHVDILDTYLSDLDKDYITTIAAELSKLEPELTGIHSVLDVQIINKNTAFDVVVHGNQARWIIELIPVAHFDARDVRRGMRILSRERERILNAYSLDESLQIACNATRECSGFSRVNIYQYLPDWSVRVVAESRENHMQSFLGLHFPDTDISRQARTLANSVPYRAIFSVHGETHDILQHSQHDETSLDLSYCLLRSVSFMHNYYLQNMDVSASFSISLFLDDKLWGLIVCHHDETRVLPFDLWTSLRELGLALSNRIAHELKRNTGKNFLDLHMVKKNILDSDLRHEGKLMDVVDKFGPPLMKLIDADGFALKVGDDIHLSGETPPRNFIPELVEWVYAQADEGEHYQTCSLHKHWPKAEKYRDSACGVLLQPSAQYKTCQIVWFRSPLAEKIEWATEIAAGFTPEADITGATTLLPPSFATWIGTHNDVSKAWTDTDLIIAQEILRAMQGILVSVLILAEENTRLQSFAASAAAHDIKAPLRQIEMALKVMEEDNFDTDTVRDWHHVATDSTRMLKNFTTGILDYMSVPDATHSFAPIDLEEVFSDIQKLTMAKVAQHDATIMMNISHQIMGERSLITSLFLNLIYNALNYAADYNAVINIDSVEFDNQWIEISVADNGIGIPVEHAEQVFNPSVRLNTKKDVEGSGLGLSICKQIVHAHNGSIHLDTSYTNGARFLVRLPQADTLQTANHVFS